jgi:TolB protein
MRDRLGQWMKDRRISPVMVLAVMNLVFIVAFVVVLVLFINNSQNVSLTPQVIVLPNNATPGENGVLPTPEQQVQGISVNVPTLTAGPSPTPPLNPFDVGGTIAMVLRRNGRSHIWAISPMPGRAQVTRLTSGLWDDRDPAWSPDGQTLAFSSNRGSGWDLYLLDIASGEAARLTSDAGFEGNPTWSPDGAYIAYEGYQGDNFDIYVISAQGGFPVRVTRHPAPDFAPSWSPRGRSIAFVSYRGGGVNPDLYTFNLDEPDEARSVTRITDTPDVAEDEPQWSNDGLLLVYSDTISPLNIIYTKLATAPGSTPIESGIGLYPGWTPDGSGIVTAISQGGRDFVGATALGPRAGTPLTVGVDGKVGALSWTYATLPAELKGSMAEAARLEDPPLWTEKVTAPTGGDPPYTLITMPDLRANVPALSDRVDESFLALRLRVIAEAGWDFLQELDNATILPQTRLDPGLPYESWNKAGRAFDISQPAINDGWGVLMREEIGNRLYWRLWVRVRQGDGSLGEPLRRVPWDFRTRFSGDPVAYDNGGSYFAEVPQGYFVDFGTLAGDYGWERVPSEENWRIFYPGVQYWHFEFRGGQDWSTAMREIWAAKDVATATPFMTPTFTPSPTLSPTNTLFPPTASFTPSLTPSITRTPTNTFTATLTPSKTTAPTRLGQPSATITPTFTASSTQTNTATATASRTAVPSPTTAATATQTP